MAFSNYKTIGEVLKAFQVIYTEANFISEIPFNIPDYFREDLELMMRDAVVDNSEFAICENLIYPVLKEVWKTYRKHFILWSHESLNYDEKLSGFPEYILAKRSPLGKVVFDKPYFILVEAKQDNFETGWAQCLAEMIAAQRLNNDGWFGLGFAKSRGLGTVRVQYNSAVVQYPGCQFNSESRKIRQLGHSQEWDSNYLLGAGEFLTKEEAKKYGFSKPDNQCSEGFPESMELGIGVKLTWGNNTNSGVKDLFERAVDVWGKGF